MPEMNSVVFAKSENASPQRARERVKIVDYFHNSRPPRSPKNKREIWRRAPAPLFLFASNHTVENLRVTLDGDDDRLRLKRFEIRRDDGEEVPTFG